MGNSNWTRRQFLTRVGQAGGVGALYETMTVLGLINVPDVFPGPPRLPVGYGAGKSVVILGGGIGGLTAAYELRKVDYQVTIVEAFSKLGGRSKTLRRGDQIIEQSNLHGRTVQTCNFDEGLYLNAGPGRLPYHHRRVLHYCSAEELNVPLEIYVMNTSANLFQTQAAFGGEAHTYQRVAHDTQGHIAELLAKAITRGNLDFELSEEDQSNMLDLLRRYGPLGQGDCSNDIAYCRTGCRRPLTVYQDCLPNAKLRLSDLLDSRFWDHNFYQPNEYEWQPTLFQPAGGMDKIVQGFQSKLEDMGVTILLDSPVSDIQIRADDVRVEYSGGMLTADTCISNIPLPVLKGIPANFSSDFRSAVNTVRFAPTCKVGWQANERFWEAEEIYGGISWIDHPIVQIWYPSNDYFSQKGTLTGAYNFSNTAFTMGAMSLSERLRVAREGGIRLHSKFLNYGVVPEDKGLSVAWYNVPYQKGGWAYYEPGNPEDDQAYSRLLSPDGSGRFYVVGDQVSSLPGWQEGAMMSAQHVVEQMGELRSKKVRRDVRAPDSKALTEGW